jgi:hypothetical protein
LQDPIRYGGARLARPFERFQVILQGDGGGEADESVFGGPVMARREGLDAGLPVLVEGAHLRGEADQAVRTMRPVEGLYADRVAGRDEGAVLAGDEEGVHPEQPREGARAALRDEPKRHLVV